MDHLWSFWKFLSCGDEHRAYHGALWVKKYLLCGRNIYNPLPFDPYVFDPPFSIERPSQYITARVVSENGFHLDDGKMQYEFGPDEVHMKSYHKEKTTHFRICCGCAVEDPEDKMYSWFRERPIVYKYVPNREGLHPYESALLKFAEFNKETPVGMLKLDSYLSDSTYEQPIREKRFRKIMGASKFSVPFLILSFPDSGYKPWVELAEYQHLSFYSKSQKVTLTEKMLNCGFLHIDAVITNPQELENFRGFGLLIGEFDRNGFTFDRVIQEVEHWKNKNPSSLECFGLFKFDIKDDPTFDETVDRLKSYSPTGDIVRVNKAPHNVEAMFLDEEKEISILFVQDRGICFVRGGYEKWIRVFEYIY